MATQAKKTTGTAVTVAGSDATVNATATTVSTDRRPSGRSDEHSQQLWLKFTKNPADQKLRNQLMEHYLPLVRYSAERLWARLPDGVELDDLISAGIFGLMDAITAFDLERGVKFETYCSTRVRGAMLDELRSMDWVPRLVRSKASKLNQATSRLAMELGRQPTEKELSGEMNISIAELEQMINDANAINLVSLDKRKWRDDGYKDVREIDVVENKRSVSPTKREQKNDLIRLVTKGLSRNERLIVILYYYEEMTMKEIGSTLSLSESRVSQMHSSIVRRLQNQLDNRRTEFAA
jgi:RNA polymerase sigma factor for flagellar operon FliA